MNLLAALQAAGVGSFPTLTNPTAVLMGDSITTIAHYNVALATAGETVTRDASGVMTGATVANNQLFGTPLCIPVNLVDTSYEVLARNNYTAGSTLGSTAGSSSTFALFSGVLSAGSTTTDNGPSPIPVGASLIDMGRITTRGIWTWLQSKYKGGLTLLANLGHPSAAAPFTSQVSYVTGTLHPQLALYMALTNNFKNGQDTATAWAAAKTDLDALLAAGIPTVIFSPSPLGTGFSGYATTNPLIQAVLPLMQAYVAAHPTNFLLVDMFTPLYDTVNHCMFAQYTPDSTHLYSNALQIGANAAYATLSPTVTANSLLPSSAADAGTVVNGHTRLATATRGPWTGTGTVTPGGTGSSGLVPTGWNASRNSGTGTVVCSVIDPGGGLPVKARFVITPASASESYAIFPFGSNISLATLGISATDNAEYSFVANLDWSGGTASGVGGIVPTLATNGGGVYGIVSDNQQSSAIEPVGSLPDSIVGRATITGWLQMSNSSITLLVPSFTISFGALTGQSFTIDVSQVAIVKK